MIAQPAIEKKTQRPRATPFGHATHHGASQAPRGTSAGTNIVRRCARGAHAITSISASTLGLWQIVLVPDLATRHAICARQAVVTMLLVYWWCVWTHRREPLGTGVRRCFTSHAELKTPSAGATAAAAWSTTCQGLQEKIACLNELIDGLENTPHGRPGRSATHWHLRGGRRERSTLH